MPTTPQEAMRALTYLDVIIAQVPMTRIDRSKSDAATKTVEAAIIEYGRLLERLAQEGVSPVDPASIPDTTNQVPTRRGDRVASVDPPEPIGTRPEPTPPPPPTPQV